MPDPPRNDLAWTRSSSTPGFKTYTKTALVSEIDALLERLYKLGIAVNGSSRLYKAREIIAALAKHEMPSEKQLGADALRTILITMRDVMQWSAIARYGRNSDDHIYREKSLLLLKDGATLSENNELPTPGRDVQFELFANACWNAAGVLTQLASPPAPDLLITTALWQFGAEAKRIKAIKQLKNRAKEANKQLRYCQAGGLLLTDLSSFFESPKEHSTVTGALRDLEGRLYNFMHVRLPLVRAATSARACFAWTAYAQTPYFLSSGFPMQIFQWKTFNLCGERDPRWLHIVQFTSALNRFADTSIAIG